MATFVGVLPSRVGHDVDLAKGGLFARYDEPVAASVNRPAEDYGTVLRLSTSASAPTAAFLDCASWDQEFRPTGKQTKSKIWAVHLGTLALWLFIVIR